MKTLTAICLSLGLSALATGQAQADPSLECGVANDNQVEIGNCVGAMEAAVDQTIEIALGFAVDSAKELDTVTGRDDGTKALTASQQAWSAFRDSQCEYIGSTYGSGSGSGIAISSCRVELGRQRVEALMNGLN